MFVGSFQNKVDVKIWMQNEKNEEKKTIKPGLGFSETVLFPEKLNIQGNPKLIYKSYAKSIVETL